MMYRNIFLLFLVFTLSYSCVWAIEESEEEIQREAFKKSLEEQLPLTQEQIQEFRKRMDATQEATHDREPPKMSSRTERLSFDAGHTPPTVRIAPGYTTVLSFHDSTGQPWPLTSVVVGNSEYYDVQRPEGEENIITVSTSQRHVDSNLAITFQDKTIPASIQLTTVPDGSETDSIVAFRAEARGPKASEPTIGPRAEKTINETMMSFIDRIPPESAQSKRLSPSVPGVELWAVNGKFYLRSEHPLIWPAWAAVAKGPHGISVYEMPEVPSIIVSKDGNSVSIEIKTGETDG